MNALNKLFSFFGDAETHYREAFRLETSSQDFQKALRLYEKAARMGHVEAQYYCGFMYLKGRGIKKRDFEKAYELVEMAAKQDYPKAQYLLSQMYYFGEGIARNKALGDKWMAKFKEHETTTKILFLHKYY